MPRITDQLSIGEARRIALAAQGFAKLRPSSSVTQRHVAGVLRDVGVIQIDSVNVLVRSQELPLFARLGSHKRTAIADATKRGKIFEYWAHEAAHVPVEFHPLFRWKMDAARRGNSAHWGLSTFYAENKAFVENIFQRVVTDGPLSSRELSVRKGPKGTWWDWDEAKTALEYLFWTGQVMSRARGSDFARIYDIPERVLPGSILAMATPSEHDARKALVAHSATSMGIATAFDLADYFRQKLMVVRPLIKELVEDGDLREVRVEGWKDVAYLHSSARLPQSIHTRALLSPFDSLVWCRPRNERLFNFHYRIEIYTPQHKRIYGYYVLPFMLNGEIVGRVDVKAHRAERILKVHASFAEAGVDRGAIAKHLLAELTEMATWLELDDVVVDRLGNLSSSLRSAMKVGVSVQ
ncbi:MAG: winged helix-turn-helix domain-containing protein [Ilumatobacteraceae bacterium]